MVQSKQSLARSSFKHSCTVDRGCFVSTVSVLGNTVETKIITSNDGETTVSRSHFHLTMPACKVKKAKGKNKDDSTKEEDKKAEGLQLVNNGTGTDRQY
eukprot:3611623-Amphidinium_carterae.1